MNRYVDAFVVHTLEHFPRSSAFAFWLIVAGGVKFIIEAAVTAFQ